MARLRSKRTGVIVNVADDQVGALSHRFEPVEDEAKPARRSTRKKASDDE